MTTKSGLGRGLSSLIPKKDEETDSQFPQGGGVKEQGTIFEVPIALVHQNPRQPRKNFAENDLADLVSSVKKHGILQPLVVSVRENDGEYELIAGERRLRAAKEVGLEQVPIVVRTVNEQEKLELALIENIQRQDLNAVEEALAYKALIDEFNLTQEEVAREVGKSRSAVANTIRLLDLPNEIRKALQDSKISRSHARTLLAEPDSQKQKHLFEAILAGGVTVREVEARAGGKKRSNQAKDPNIVDHENRLQEKLGTRVEIQERDGRGKIIIEFYSREELGKLLDQFNRD